MKKNILVVEDDPVIYRLISQVLVKEGYKVSVAKNLHEASQELKSFRPDMVILDRRLPDGDGLNLCREVKPAGRGGSTALMFLSSRKTTPDKVLGLKMGADDYLTKPFHVDELLARVEVLLHRVGGQEAEEQTLACASMELDAERHVCSVAGKDVHLWPKEFELLKIFLSRPGKVLSKEYLSQQVWGHEFIDTSRALEMAVRRLKQRLGREGRRIETIKGYGFRLNNEKQEK